MESVYSIESRCGTKRSKRKLRNESCNERSEPDIELKCETSNQAPLLITALESRTVETTRFDVVSLNADSGIQPCHKLIFWRGLSVPSRRARSLDSRCASLDIVELRALGESDVL